MSDGKEEEKNTLQWQESCLLWRKASLINWKDDIFYLYFNFSRQGAV